MHDTYQTPDYPGKGSTCRERYEANPVVAWLYAVVAGIIACVTLVFLVLIWGTGDLLWLFLLLVIVFVFFVGIVCNVLWGWYKHLSSKQRQPRRSEH